MGAITEQQLKQQIKTGGLSRLYLVYGEEGYLKEHYVNQMAQKAVPKGFETFNLHRFDGKEDGMEAVFSAAQALPMLCEKSCIVARDFPLDSLSGPQADLFAELLADPPESCVVIFWMDAVEAAPKKNAKWRAVLTKMQKAGDTVALGRRNLTALCKLLQSGAAKRACTFEPDAAAYLVSLAGDDLQVLLNELDKVCAYVGAGAITREAVDAVGVRSLDATAFDLVKAITAGDCSHAYLLLDTLFAQKAEPVLVSGALIAAYVDMYRAKIAAAVEGNPLEAAKWFQYKNKEFRLRNAARDGARLTVEQLRVCLDLLDTMDMQLKSTAADKRLVLERAIVELLRACA